MSAPLPSTSTSPLQAEVSGGPERVVILVDLHPLLLCEPSSSTTPCYLSSILAAAKRILNSPELSRSLFAFRFFFSSLSPVLSTSLLHRILPHSSSPFLSFDLPKPALKSLSAAISSITSTTSTNMKINFNSHSNNAVPQAHHLCAALLGLLHDYAWEEKSPTSNSLKSNLILLFASTPEIPAGFVGLDADVSVESDVLSRNFLKIFLPLIEGSATRDIHFGWINVKTEAGFLEKEIRELGWGFCSIDSIVLGSALIPIGLILPCIVIGVDLSNLTSRDRSFGADLLMEIADVNGKPLECKMCELDAFELMPLRGDLRKFCPFTDNGAKNVIKIQVIEVLKTNHLLQNHGKFVDLFLLRMRSGEMRRQSEEFFADKVLKLLCREDGGNFSEGEIPVWGLLLALLYDKNYWAIVSIPDGNGAFLQGLLKPFTVNCGFLSFMEKDFVGFGELRMPVWHGFARSDDSSGRRKMSKFCKTKLREITWSSFYDAAFAQDDDTILRLNLLEVYFNKECRRSKKLLFLKSWMKQFTLKRNEQKHTSQILHEEGVQNAGSLQKPELHVQPSLADAPNYCNDSINNQPSQSSSLAGSGNFFENLEEKIQLGLCKKDVDLLYLAERLVCLSLSAIRIEHGKKTKKDASEASILDELSQLLLLKPKDLASKYKKSNLVSLSSNPHATTCRMDNKVREHELQILFRMEILRSKIGAGIQENIKQKMTKEICSLLRNIEFNLEGDLFHGGSLLGFAERTIKIRYADALEDVVHNIFNEMVFFSFDGSEFDGSDSIPSSNNDESQRVKYSLLAENVAEAQEDFGSAHQQQLTEAQERRNRDRQFSSFTSWMPDLLRVWAPKQHKVERPKLDYLVKPSKKRKQHISKKDVVCETPMSGKEVASNPGCDEVKSLRSVSKALFNIEADIDFKEVP